MADDSYTPTELAEAERICRATLYRLWQLGEGPRYYFVGKQRRISEEARREWQLEREARAFKEAADAAPAEMVKALLREEEDG